MLIERMQRVVFLFVFLKQGRDCPSDMWGGGTLVGLTHPEVGLQAAFRTGSIFEACGEMLETAI